MTRMAIARSSMTTSLARYRRSWGLWVLLLVAPVGARFMISDEDGRGIAIAIGDHLPVLDSPTLGVWLGIVVSTLLLPIGYIYLRANTTRRQPWQVEEVTAASRYAIMFGRFGADVVVLLAMLTALTLAGWFLGWLMVTGPLNVLTLTYALWLVAAPALVGLAALRLLFDALPWLRRGLGDLCFYVLWMTSIIIPSVVDKEASSFATNMYDYPGFVRPMTAGAPAGDKDFGIGGIEVKPGRISLDVMAGLNAPGYAMSRLAWVGIAVLIVGFSGLVYRMHKPPRRVAGTGRFARLLAAGPPPPADLSARPARPAKWPTLALVVAEARLIGSGRVFKRLALAAAVAGLFGDYRHLGSPAALAVLVFALSAHAGRSEARGLLTLTSTARMPPMARRAAFVVAGVAWSACLAIPATLVMLDETPMFLAAATGLIASLLATSLASVSGSAFAPRLVLLILWYGYLSS